MGLREICSNIYTRVKGFSEKYHEKDINTDNSERETMFYEKPNIDYSIHDRLVPESTIYNIGNNLRYELIKNPSTLFDGPNDDMKEEILKEHIKNYILDQLELKGNRRNNFAPKINDGLIERCFINKNYIDVIWKGDKIKSIGSFSMKQNDNFCNLSHELFSSYYWIDKSVYSSDLADAIALKRIFRSLDTFWQQKGFIDTMIVGAVTKEPDLIRFLMGISKSYDDKLPGGNMSVNDNSVARSRMQRKYYDNKVPVNMQTMFDDNSMVLINYNKYVEFPNNHYQRSAPIGDAVDLVIPKEKNENYYFNGLTDWTKLHTVACNIIENKNFKPLFIPSEENMLKKIEEAKEKYPH